MSTVAAYSGSEAKVRSIRIAPQTKRDSLAPVIDLNQARLRRSKQDVSSAAAGRQRSDAGDALRLSPIERIELERSISRHPAGVARGSSQSRLQTQSMATPVVQPVPRPRQVEYVTRIPIYAKVAGWVAAFVLVVSAALGLASVFGTGAYQGQTWTHTVATGESIWGLAASVGSSRGLEDVVEDIRSLNGLKDATLIPGQQVILPFN